mmetsp:Transcript_144806/g.361119  ORF Transcript_144806/g.361119 Transcript_144806/m.361119 type:complete len:252 (-) Transcript_144806:681-1436(-)
MKLVALPIATIMLMRLAAHTTPMAWRATLSSTQLAHACSMVLTFLLPSTITTPRPTRVFTEAIRTSSSTVPHALLGIRAPAPRGSSIALQGLIGAVRITIGVKSLGAMCTKIAPRPCQVGYLRGHRLLTTAMTRAWVHRIATTIRIRRGAPSRKQKTCPGAPVSIALMAGERITTQTTVTTQRIAHASSRAPTFLSTSTVTATTKTTRPSPSMGPCALRGIRCQALHGHHRARQTVISGAPRIGARSLGAM